MVYSDHVDDKRAALQKMDQLEARFVFDITIQSIQYGNDLNYSRINPLPLGLSSLRHILKVEIIRAEFQDKKQIDENDSLQYACAIAVLK